MSPRVAPYGEWESPITGEPFTTRSVTLSQLRIDGSDTYWVEGHPKENGRSTLLRRTAAGETTEVLPLIDGTRLPDVKTRVHEYGGKAYAVSSGLIVFSDGADSRVYLYDVTDTQTTARALTTLSKSRYADFELDESRGLVYAVREDHSPSGEPHNTLVAIPLDGSAARDDSALITVFSGTDFVAAPALSPDGTKLAWMTWNHPDMPWNHSALHVGALDEGAQVTHHVNLVDSPDVCVYEPRWTLKGDLIHVDDSTGWANLFRTEGFDARPGDAPDSWTHRLRTRALHPSSRAFSQPHWQLGLHSFDNFDYETLICSWSEDLTWHIGTVRTDNGVIEEWPTGWWPIGNVASSDARVVFLADSPTHDAAIVQVENGQTSIIRPSSQAQVSPELISPAQVMSWPTADGEKAHGFYYAPQNPEFCAPEGQLPPLIVNVHGGPTTSTRPGLKIPLQYWTSRGFTVLDVNYRGSTGSGRAYRERLSGNWGVVDVQDCAAGARFLIERGLVDPSRVAIRGGSAGGFTALCALATTDTFTAGTSLYGIADLRLLEQETHKFESGYAYRLLGSSSLNDAVWVQRSPLFHVDDITAPLLLLQGADDHVVPPNQAQQMYEALAERGNVAALRIYEGEGHGFRKAATIRDAWAAELAFYARVWGMRISVDSDIEIANL